MYLSVGQKAPEFILPDENGELHSLNNYAGQHILLYFYPKDDTPGCTTEACNFRDDYSQYQNAEVTILGVSPDTPASHFKFKNKYQLPYSLLADEDHQVCESYGVWGPKKNFGNEYYGVYRTTYLISPNGIIQEVFKKVSPAEHSIQVLALLK